MAFATEDAVKALLSPFHARIRFVFEDARAEVAAVEDCRRSNGFADFRYPRTLADNIYDAMSNHVESVFADEPDVRVIYERQSFKVLFYQNGQQPILARFKKGDHEGRGQNQDTQAVLAFNDPNAVFPGFPEEAVCLDITYSHDDLGLRIGEVTVVLRDGDRILWSYSIDDIEDGQISLKNVVQLPSNDGGSAANDDTSESLVSAKPKRDDDSEEV